MCLWARSLHSGFPWVMKQIRNRKLSYRCSSSGAISLLSIKPNLELERATLIFWWPYRWRAIAPWTIWSLRWKPQCSPGWRVASNWGTTWKQRRLFLGYSPMAENITFCIKIPLENHFSPVTCASGILDKQTIQKLTKILHRSAAAALVTALTQQRLKVYHYFEKALAKSFSISSTASQESPMIITVFNHKGALAKQR